MTNILKFDAIIADTVFDIVFSTDALLAGQFAPCSSVVGRVFFCAHTHNLLCAYFALEDDQGAHISQILHK